MGPWPNPAGLFLCSCVTLPSRNAPWQLPFLGPGPDEWNVEKRHIPTAYYWNKPVWGQDTGYSQRKPNSCSWQSNTDCASLNQATICKWGWLGAEYSGASQDHVNSFRENSCLAKTSSCEMRFPIGMHWNLFNAFQWGQIIVLRKSPIEKPFCEAPISY